ncbi:MAG: hypothetical protein IJ551_09640 [Prevotella sp.]|nr:hypothetical protein [Prevotella sp.]
MAKIDLDKFICSFMSYGTDVKWAVEKALKDQGLEYKDGQIKAENDDESIRKNCIHFLELQKKHHASTYEIDECIAWLEKQNPTEENKGNNDGIVNSNEDFDDFVRWFVEQRVNNYLHIPLDDEVHEWANLILEHATEVLNKESALGWSERHEPRRDDFIAGAQWADKNMINRACKWLSDNLLTSNLEKMSYNVMTEETKKQFIEDFRKAMEE